MTQPTEQQKSRVIFEFLKLGECWHEWRSSYDPAKPRFDCKHCFETKGWAEPCFNPNYFARDLPDNIRVDMVTAAIDKFGVRGFVAEGMQKAMNEPLWNYQYRMLYAPASVIAEAIYTLIQEQGDDR